MTKWEYKIFIRHLDEDVERSTFSTEDQEKWLCDLGKVGWENYLVIPGYNSRTTLFYFKRHLT